MLKVLTGTASLEGVDFMWEDVWKKFEDSYE